MYGHAPYDTKSSDRKEDVRKKISICDFKFESDLDKQDNQSMSNL